MLNYNYDPITFEYIGSSEARLDPKESEMQGKDVYLCPANATHIAPPLVVENEIEVFKDGEWKIRKDYRKTAVYDTETGDKREIIDIGIVPEDLGVITVPPVNIIKPKYIDGDWVEQALIYDGMIVESKADVDKQTSHRISQTLGEEKAKTEKLIAGAEECPSWDKFIEERSVILAEGEEFISTNNLT